MGQNIPIFPDFIKLELGHKNVMSAIADNFPSSDFNFVGLFTWDTTDSVMISMLNDNLVIKSADYVTHQIFYSFIGNNEVDNTAKIIINYAKENGHDSVLKLVPESMAEKFESSSLHVLSEDRDNHDYILSVQNLVEFKSNMYRGKRNLLNRYSKTYGEQSVQQELDLDNEATIKAIDKVLTGWRDSRNKDDKDIHDEAIAIKKALDNHQALSMRAYGVYHNDTLIAFTLFELKPNKIAIIHFDKADVRYEGIFEHLKHNFAKHLASLDIESINYEQDLGVEGLRRAKESYHPVRYIKKYTLSSKDQTRQLP